MADFTALKTAIQTYIKQNGNEEINGEKLQEILLSVVTTLGDSAINDLITALNAEVAARQNADSSLEGAINQEGVLRSNADSTLQGNINAEATARANGDTALSNRLGSTITSENTAADQIGAEAEAREAADTSLQGLIDGITDNIENGYVYVGIATPSTTPVTGKVFYLALQGGQYIHFGNTAVMQGINIFKYNGSSWLHDAYIGISDKPIPSGTGLVKAGGTFDFVMDNGSAFDISKYFASGSTLATYENLGAALTALDGLDAAYKRGGMSIRFVQSSDNKYVQFFCTADEFTTDVTKWQGVDDEPTANSENLVKSGGVKNGLNKLKQNTAGLIEAEADADFGICDEEGNVIVEFKGGNIRTKNFDSQKILKILFIGNSFTYDALSCVKGLLSELMPNYNIVIGVVYNGGESLMGYDEGGMERTISQYSKLKDGEWSSPAISSLTLRNAVENDDWDVISFQQASVDSVDYRSYQPYLSNLINKMYEENSKECKIVFMLTTPLSGSDHGVANFTNQASAAKDVMKKTSVYSIIPVGTAIQNLRSIPYFQNYGDDGDMMKESHLQTGIGMFVESLAIVEWLMRFMKEPTKTVYGSTFIPDELTDYYITRGSITGINERNVRLAQQAAILANNDFSVITDMNTQNDYFAYKNLEKLFYPYSFCAANSVGSTVGAPQFNTLFARSVKYPCSVGDSFTITGTGGSSASRLWLFADSSDIVLSIADAGAVANELVVTAPAGAAYFMMNPTMSNEYSLTKN